MLFSRLKSPVIMRHIAYRDFYISHAEIYKKKQYLCVNEWKNRRYIHMHKSTIIQTAISSVVLQCTKQEKNKTYWADEISA